MKAIPEDINVELLLSILSERSCKVAFRGLHKRNSYKDIIDIEEKNDGTLLLSLCRNSLYNALPECLFHAINRFENIPKREEKERFAEECRLLEKETENAYLFFAPLDLLLLRLRVSVREHLQNYVETNRALINILADRLSKQQQSNRFIQSAIYLLPMCKYIRGDKTLLTIMLRKIFKKEGLQIYIHQERINYQDSTPRYADNLDSILGTNYAGNVFEESVTVCDINYWPDDECDSSFMKMVEEIEVFREFFQDYFLSIEETLRFNIRHSDDVLTLAGDDNDKYYYLNYNTNL